MSTDDELIGLSCISSGFGTALSSDVKPALFSVSGGTVAAIGGLCFSAIVDRTDNDKLE